MRSFELYGTVGAVVCCLDSINYLLCEKDVQTTFSLVHNYLDPDGLFLFDVNTPYKFENIYGDNAYILEDELDGKLTFYKSSLGDNLYKVRIEKEVLPEEEPKPTDPDKNGSTDEADVIYIMQFILGYKGTSGDNCDINKDGRIDLRDAVVLLQNVRDQ